jgi:hypothetical protein
VDWLKQVRFSKIRQKIAENKIIGKSQQKSTKLDDEKKFLTKK